MKKIISKLALLLVLVLTLSTFFGVATISANDVGDVDGDGSVTSADAIYLLYSSVFGEDEYPIAEGCDFNADGKVDSRDAVYLLYNVIWGDEYYPLPGSGDIGSETTGRVAITLVDEGKSTLYKLIPGADLPVLDDRFDSEWVRSRFLGWYDETKTEKFTVVPDTAATYYAVFAEDDTEGKIKLINGGNVELSDLAVGAALPTLSSVKESVSDYEYLFDGWYDETGAVKYTTVTEGVDVYYARYANYASYSFETKGYFDPNGQYSSKFSTKGIACWERAVDPNGNNLVLKANIGRHGNNTHVPVQLFEGSTEGFKVVANKKYMISFDYYLETESDVVGDVSVRSSKLENLGKAGEKTDPFASASLSTLNSWDSSYVLFDTIVEVDDKDEGNPTEYDLKPYLILMSDGMKDYDAVLYIDNLVIREYDAAANIIIKAPANVTLNNNGEITKLNGSYIGDALPTVNTEYYGAKFLGWYGSDLAKRYANIPANNATLYAKYDGIIMNFESTGAYDPNGKLAASNGLSPYAIVADPTNADNKVIGAAINRNNAHFGIKSPYSDVGYTITNGTTYEISFKYYIDASLPENEQIHVEFRGCDEANIGISGGKSNPRGNIMLETKGSWVYETVKFTYDGTQPYLIMLAQSYIVLENDEYDAQHSIGANVYFDDIVVKTVAEEVTYSAKNVVLDGKNLNTYDEINIVVPQYNFPYVATLQCEELDKVLTGITGKEVNIVKDGAWTKKDNQFNVFVNNVGADAKLTKDQCNRTWGEDCVTVNGGSTWALAMGVSQLAKAVNKNTGITKGASATESYDALIGNYSTATYYRPTFAEDFDQEEIDTTIWAVSNSIETDARDYVDEEGNVQSGKDNGWKRARSAEHSILRDGKFVIKGAYDKDTKIFYGGMLRSHGRMEYLHGYLETSVITPHGQSLWSAVWLTPHGTTSGLYRPEVDVNESFGNAATTTFNMHAWLTTAGKNLGYEKYSFDTYTSRFQYKEGGIFGGLVGATTYNYRNAYAPAGETLNDRFHTFGFMWTESYAQFIVDGDVRLTYNFEGTDSHYNKYGMTNVDAYNEYMSVIVSMTVGNASSGSNPVLGADYWNTTNEYIVDYVHVYQIDGQKMNINPREAVAIDRTHLGAK